MFKFLVYSLLICLSFTLASKNFADESSQDYLEKVYVEPGQLHLIKEGIFFLKKDGCIARACGVFCDRAGLYILAKEPDRCSGCGCSACPGCINQETGKCIIQELMER